MFGGLRAKVRYPGRFFRPDTPLGAEVYYRLARTLIREHRPALPASETIPADKGYLVAKVEGIEPFRYEGERVDWSAKIATAKKPFLLTHDVPFQRARSIADQVLPIVSQYIGSLPVMQSAQFWYSPNAEHAGRSQLFHMDAEDRRQVKCFIPLRTVDRDSGPLTILPADVTARVYRALVRDGHTRRRNVKLPDDVIGRYFDPSELVELTGEPGTVALVDTCRCYHFGSRKSAKPRLLMHLHFMSAWAMEMPIFGRRFSDPVYGCADAMFPVIRRRSARSS